MKKRRVFASACLTGAPVRWRGDSKPADLSVLGDDVEIIPFCPELAAGLGCPRDPIELAEDSAGGIKVVDVATREDRTPVLRAACEKCADALEKGAKPDLIILKSKSPSCGKAAPLHDATGKATGRFAPGTLAETLMRRFPDIPVLDETQLRSVH